MSHKRLKLDASVGNMKAVREEHADTENEGVAGAGVERVGETVDWQAGAAGAGPAGAGGVTDVGAGDDVKDTEVDELQRLRAVCKGPVKRGRCPCANR